MPEYTVFGRVVGSDGAPIVGATVTVHEITSLCEPPTLEGEPATTGPAGRYAITWTESSMPTRPWDLFVRASTASATAESALISELESTAMVDLILGDGAYEGLTEWERVEAKITPLLCETGAKDVPADRLEWLSRRADVFPTQLAAYVQAHRLADKRTIAAQSCYAFLRAGLPADLLGLVRAGEAAWADALRDGWARLLIPLPGDGSDTARDQKLADELAAMRELVVDAAVATPIRGVNQRALLDTAALSEAQQRTFSQLWLDHSGPIDEFWTTVRASSLSAEEPVLRFTIQASTLVGGHVPTLSALQTERGDGRLTTVADAAAWSVAQWDATLLAHGVTAPAAITGADADAIRGTYARALFNMFEREYPTASFRASLARDEQAASAPANTTWLSTFLANNPDFELGASTIGPYLDGASAPWTGIDQSDQAQARGELELVDRVYRITPPIGRYATTKALLDQGISSATQVVALTRNEFVAQYGPVMPSADHDADALAAAVWDIAAKINSLVIGLSSQLALAKTNADFVPLAVGGAEQFENAASGLAQLSTILGKLDYCACERCRSVFSPAAYLADLLAFLKARPAAQAPNALEVLLARRPDLAHILLDCANTNTPLPYIDLVNELLEDFIGGDGSLSASSRQTTWTAAELRLHPEHLDAAVYASSELTQTVHPWTLPFSLATAETQTYLQHLGVPRHELMRRVLPVAPTDAQLDAIAADVLGLDAVAFEIVTGLYQGNASQDGREFWGFEASRDEWVGILDGTSQTGDIGELLLRGRFELAELRELLGLRFINPDGAIELVWAPTCALADATIAGLNADVLDRLHRFVRLQRLSKIPARMLDVLVCDVLGSSLSRATLRDLAKIVELKARLRLAWDELASFWATALDTRDETAVYPRRFLAKEFGDIDPAFEPASDPLTLTGESSPASPIIAAQLPRVLAGLRLGEREVRLLAASSLASDDFSLANLTALFRCATLARALRLSIVEFVRTVELTGLDPFTDPAATNTFLDRVDGLRTAGFSLDELDWLLRHTLESDPLDEAAVARTLEQLGGELLTIDDEAARLRDPDGYALETNLGALLEPADIATTIAIVERTAQLVLDDRDAFLDATFATILDTAAAKGVLSNYDDEQWLDVADRRAWLLRRIVAHQRRTGRVLDTITASFGLPPSVAEALVTRVLTSPSSDAPLLEVYRRPFATTEELEAGLTPDTHPDLFAAWTRLAKAALICERFELRADEVTWYSGHAGWLDLDALPLSDSDPDVSFEAWDRLRRALLLRELSRPDELAPEWIAKANTLAEAIGVLADHAGWDPDATLSVATSLGYDDADTSAVAEEVIPARLRTILETADRLDVAPSVLFDWAAPVPTIDDATALELATRAKYGEDRWPDVAKPLRDAIRHRQRDALVDAAIALAPDFHTANDVFEHLLIDVEMSACMMSSRIKQAIAAVQIFIHRVLLHLETDEVTFDPEAIARWEWMKNYRVWEANRKVFLYPENWIEPQLRPDETPEFEELEANLTQGELDATRVEQALGTYLEKLARVANLEMIGVYEVPDTKELWLLGRTHAAPHEWFVRRRTPSGLWESWQAIPGAIEGDAVVILVHRGRLQLFWATRHDVSLANDRHAYQFRIHHLERGPDGWGKPATSKPSPSVFLPEHEHRLHFLIVGARVFLTVLWQAPDLLGGTPGIATRFCHDSVDQRTAPRDINWMGEHLHGDQVDVDGYAIDIDILSGRQFIGLSQSYDFDGQRNVKTGFAGDGNLDELQGARFTQDDQSLLLFSRPSSNTQVTFVHHANIWTPIQDATRWPAIYDDRRRKYLLEPDWGPSDDANPVRIGLLEPAQLVLCPEPAAMVPPPSKHPRQRAQRLRDGLVEVRPWGASLPGRGQVQLADSPNAPVYAHQILLDDCQAMVGAKLDLELDVDEDEDEALVLPAQSVKYALGLTELYHPFVRDLQEALARDGLAGLYAPPTSSSLFRQLETHDPFGPNAMDVNPEAIHGFAPIERFEFDFDRPYATYNWEIFYHVPMLIAGKLATEQRWDDAQRWYHLIFNPIDLVDLQGETATSKFWRIKPFFEQAATLAKDQFEVMLGIGVTQAEQEAAVEAFSKQVAAWEASPFDPHAVARVRPGVYQRALLREYFDNLIAWADHLFRRDTIESITEATVLYIVVAQLLGPRPQEVPGPSSEAKTFAQLDEAGLDAFSNAMIELESWVHLPPQPAKKLGCGEYAPLDPWVQVPAVAHFWYFCYPPNPELLKYWDILADRLFKIRHCQTIDGVERQLPLFEAPIDPGLLVRATAAGVDLSSVLAELDSGLPPYRFRSVHARAVALTNSLRALGASLLSAHEKRDAEALSRLRSGHELEMLSRVREVRLAQRDEARRAIESLEASREVIQHREMHYQQLITRDLLGEEKLQLKAGNEAQAKRTNAQSLQLGATIMSAMPQVSIFPPNTTFGGVQLANVMNAVSAGLTMGAAELDYKANRAGLTAGFVRRGQDWGLQRDQAHLEVERVDRDLAAAKIRLAIAERELDNHALAVEQAEAVDEFLRGKFTNRELYDWMTRQLASVYFQTYQLAFDLAKRAERAYRHELAIPVEEPPILAFGYWDSLQKGLLAGERLGHDLERLDVAYMDRDVREFELRKSVSLARLDPDQLHALRETGVCTFEIPEVAFDLDHPGHYLRRLRAVRITIPAVDESLTSLGARLQLLSHKTRRVRTGSYPETNADERFSYGTGAGQAIATSTAVSDGGLFNLDFRDERYLPFEYAGAISTWKLQLPGVIRQFDYRTIEDVIIHLDYTAHDGGASLRDAAETNLVQIFGSEPRALVIAAHEAFSDEWSRFASADDGDHVLTLPVTDEHIPYFARANMAVTKLSYVLLLKAGVEGVPTMDLALDLEQATLSFVQAQDDAFMTASHTLTTASPPGTWTLTIADSAIPDELQTGDVLDPSKLAGLLMIIHYTLDGGS